MSDAQVVIIGNLTRDPELRYTSGNKAVTNFSVASNNRFQVNGEWQEEVSFFNCTVWNSQGENLAASCVKGTRVIVTGRLKQRTYEDKESVSRSVVEVIVDEVGPSMRWARADVTRVAGKEPATVGAPSGDRGNGDPAFGNEEPF